MKLQEIKSYVAHWLQKLESLPDNRKRAELAKLRRGIGKEPGEQPELWGILLQDMPESFLGKNGPSREEWAIYLTITLYALHRQSQPGSVNLPGNTLGKAVRELAEKNAAAGQDWRESSILRRFNALATADSMPEVSHHLRGMIQLMRSAKGGTVLLDYPQLAVDLYELQLELEGQQLAEQLPHVRLRWGQDLYRMKCLEEPETEKKEN